MITYPEFVKVKGDQVVITHKCVQCNSSKSLTVDKNRFDHYLHGGDTMRDFPELSASDREIILIADRKINAHLRPSPMPPMFICDDHDFWESDDE
tara:strand:- start:12071 stop:12355 length:285 start_codon:yes stop_codon:yes gene_type:complete